MDRGKTAEYETLRQAAEAAASIIAELEAELEAERKRIGEQIASLQAIVTAWEALSGEQLKAPASLSVPRRILARPEEPRPAESTQGYQPRAQTSAHIDAILANGALRERDIVTKLAERFGISYTRSAVNNALRRGKNSKYEQRGKLWVIKSASRRALS